jgi:transposase-like protein
MENFKYNQIVAAIEAMTIEQVDGLLTHLEGRRDADGVARLLSENLAERHCPHCGGEHIVKNGRGDGVQRFLCRACRKSFTVTTGTPFHHLRDKEKLLAYAECMADSLSIRKSAFKVGLSVSRSFRWRHRFLERINAQKPSEMSGVVEADETFFPVSYKGQRSSLPRKAKKRPGKFKDGSGGEKTPVLVAVQRGTARTFDEILAGATSMELVRALKPALSKDAVLSTDGNAAYWSVAKDLEIESGFFIASYHGKGGNGPWHVQSVNRYDASLKGWMTRFKGVATKYLANYLGWRRLLDRFTDILTPQQFLFHALRTSYI